jgi:hypothetical protein
MERSGEFDEVESTQSDTDNQVTRARVISDVHRRQSDQVEFRSKVIESTVLRTDAIG